MNDALFKNLKGAHLILIAFILALSNFMVVLDGTIANVSVPHIAGSLGSSYTQGTWVITSYAVAEAISIPLTGWLAGRFGAVKTFSIGLLGFTIFSVLCGLSTSLEMLIFNRVGQGLFGGPIMPLSQMLLVRIFSAEKQSQAIGLWAMTTVIGPILGPILGGMLSDNFSWHWIFFINLPIGILCVFAAFKWMKSMETPTEKLAIDVGGLILLVIWVVALQLMLDLGHQYDWFESPFIIGCAIITFLGLTVFMIWELTQRNSIVNIRIFRHRGFTVSVLALAFGFGAFFGSLVLLPQWLQINLQYTATWAGYITATIGIGSLIMSPIVAYLVTKIDQRILAFFGLLLLGVGAFMRTFWSNDADFLFLTLPQIIQGFALPFFFIPLSNMALTAVQPEELASAVGLMNFLRTIAGAIGASIVVTLWDNNTKVSRSGLSGHVQTEEAQRLFAQQGTDVHSALIYVSGLVDKETTTLSSNYVFLLITMVFIFAALLIWLTPKSNQVFKGLGH